MNYKHFFFTFLTSLFWTSIAFAQYSDDAVLFSQEFNGGTARFKGLGNAQTALGGDISTIAGNPAGLGFYGQSDISISLDYLNHLNKSTYFGNSTSNSDGRFSIAQAGIVLHLPTHRYDYDVSSGWLNFNIGLSYDRTNDYLKEQRFNGVNPNSSIVNNFIDNMDMEPNSQFANDIYGMYLAEEVKGNPNSFFPIVRDNGDKDQFNDFSQSGYRSRTTLSFGANYSNTLYIGGAVGMTSFKYKNFNYFDELGVTKSRDEIVKYNPDSKLADPNNDEYDYVEAAYDLYNDFEQSAEGSGIDFKLGVIYKPAPDWNLGVTFTSPTWMTVQDDSYEAKEVSFSDDGTNPFATYSFSDEYPYEYNIVTPMKFAVGVSKLFSRGLLSADAELIDYSTTKFRTIDGLDRSLEDYNNQIIKDTYQAAVNLRVGAEYLLDPIWSIRGGFNYYGSPYKDADQTNLLFTAGMGVKLSSTIYLDAAVTHNIYKYSEFPYIIDENKWGAASPVADIQNNRTNFILTLGAKF